MFVCRKGFNDVCLEENPVEALALLRGTIHESDQILRKWESEESLPAFFYYNYGVALYELGRLMEDEEFEPYLDAAEERLEDGLKQLKEDDKELYSKAHLALCKVWFAKAASQVSEDDTVSDLAVRALDAADKIVDELPSKVVVELADIVQNHGALYSSLESRNKFITWAKKTLEKILKGRKKKKKG